MRLRGSGHYLPSEVADLLGVTPRTVATWEQTGRLTAVRTTGGHRRFPVEEVHRLMQSDHQGHCYEVIPDCVFRGDPGAALASVVHHHFGGDRLAALVELAAPLALTVTLAKPEPSGES